jgi:hypothetical protein
MPIQPDHAPASAATAPDRPVAVHSPVPAPGTPPGTFLPGLQAVGAEHAGGRITRITQLAHAAPGKPDGEADTRPLLPLWHARDPGSPLPWEH